MRRFVSQVRELCAGAAFALAGFSSGRGDCARGGWAAGRCVPVGMFRACLTPAVRFCWNVLRSITPAVRFYRGVLRSSHARRTVLLECLAFGSRLSLFLLSGKERRLAGCCVSIPPWVGIALVRSRMPCGYRTSPVHFGIVRFFVAIPTECDGTRRTEPAARCECAFSQSHWPCCVFRREYAGAARPRLRQRVFDSLDSLHWIRGVGALGAARAFENNKGLSFVPTSRSTRVHGETCPSPIYARASRAVQR